MKKEINERIFKPLGSATISKSQASLLAKRLIDERDIQVTLIMGVEAVEDKPTHTDGKLDRTYKAKTIRVESIT